MNRLVCLLVATWAHSMSLAAAQDWDLVDKDVRGSIERWGIPGVAVGVVRDDEVIWQGFYGVCGAGGEQLVDSQTLFDVGSITKSFTATAAMKLAEEGSIHLDAPAREALPALEFPTGLLDRRASLRDLLSHRTGLTPDNLIFWESPLSRAEVLDRVRFLPVSAGLGQSFQYNNLMYLAAGEAIGAAKGSSWDEVLHELLLEPLGMRRTHASRRELDDARNTAHPHARYGSEWRRVPFIDLFNCAPAGSMVSCLDDLVAWVRMLLNDGRLGDVTILSPASLGRMWEEQIAVPGGAYQQIAPHSSGHAYGLGYFLHEFEGRQVVEHGGQTDGMHALLFLVPEESLGVIVLTNALHIGLPHAISYRIVHELLELEGTTSAEASESAFWSTWQQMASAMTMNAFVAPGNPIALSEADRSRRCGSYTSGRYGEAVLSEVGGGLQIELLGRTGRLHSAGGGRFSVDWGEDRFLAVSIPQITIRLGSDRAKDILVLPGVSFSRRVDSD